MQNSFPYLDILIFGVIAIFLIFRLKNILGTKTGFEEPNINKKNQSNEFTNVFPLKHSKNNSVDKEVSKILKVDNNFDVVDFLNGSKTFFEMVLKGFVSGNLDNIKQFIKPSVFNSFETAINERNKEQETLIINLKSIKEVKIIKSTISKSSMKVNVEFESLQIRSLIDKDNQTIDGDSEKKFQSRMNGYLKRK